MGGFRRFCRLIAYPMAIVMAVTSLPLHAANAAIVTTDEIIETSGAAADRTRVQEFLKRQEVRQQLESFGVDADEAAARVGSLSDYEIARIAGRIDQLPAGQNAIAAIVGAAVLIFIVLLITDLLGLTDVFPFVRK